jgi:ferredoxin
MTTKTEPAFSVAIYIAGDLQPARESLRRQCIEEGLCVTLAPTTFVYTYGAEDGVAVGLVNYPRFPKTPDEIVARACKVAELLMTDLHQSSVLVVTPEKSIWLTRRAEDQQ